MPHTWPCKRATPRPPPAAAPGWWRAPPAGRAPYSPPSWRSGPPQWESSPMTPDEIKSAITGWCSLGTGVQLVEDRSEPGADFVLGLRSGAPGTAGTIAVEARLE